ncbi:hypothetical protein GCM10009679_20580 [Saccharothrix algeriensis]|uniref:DUF5753 domain-containing protein n=1 Tax=Catellatospora bangladeshensis TaxID=310355 RepID=A0A8J3NL18_9ACTN|nr:hypothetical protein Cba03nite_34190 [Catellatospora bangladeshensis]
MATARSYSNDPMAPPTYEVIIDELAVRRFAAPAPVIAEQLDHLVMVGHERSTITITRRRPRTAAGSWDELPECGEATVA